MNVQVREGVFETNSSSTHAISIGAFPIDKTFIPKVVKFSTGMEFGWENEHYTEWFSKACYFWMTVLCWNSDLEKERVLNEYKEKITKILTDAGVEYVEFETGEYVESSWKKGHKYIDFGGYIDHYPGIDFVDDLLAEPELFLSYLFNPNSEIETGNDNDDYTPEFRADAVATYWKGN